MRLDPALAIVISISHAAIEMQFAQQLQAVREPQTKIRRLVSAKADLSELNRGRSIKPRKN